MKTISLNELELLFKIVLENLKRSEIEQLSFDDDDYYWNVPAESMNSFPTQPELEVGSLDDDIRFLKSLLQEDHRSDFLELERLASLLKYMTKKIS